MSRYQLRVHTLRSPEALVAYETIWAKRIPGVAKHRVSTHGVWTVPAGSESVTPQLYALVSLPGRRRRSGAAGGVPVQPRIPRGHGGFRYQPDCRRRRVRADAHCRLTLAVTGTEPLEVCDDLLVRVRTLRNSAEALAGRQRAWTRSARSGDGCSCRRPG
ncbi:NIPSNAP family protein [Streptomyces sp. NBC_00316]|uniref:NIPSNAP family protein n=1 Tax=Streptomyces sp. NBC_00316 TaxID=2975710 RepID=UPI003FA6A607